LSRAPSRNHRARADSMKPLMDVSPRFAFRVCAVPAVLWALTTGFSDCAGPSSTVEAGLGGRITRETATSAAPDPLRELVGELLSVMGDTIPAPDLDGQWEQFVARFTLDPEQDSRGSSPLYIRSLGALLRYHDVEVYRVSPCTYESIRALCALPAVLLTLSIDFPLQNVTPLPREQLPETQLARLRPHAERLLLASLRRVEYLSGYYRLFLSGGDKVAGLPTDHLVGQVYPWPSEKRREGYRQVVDLYVITRLPPRELNAHLSEWYEHLPYTMSRPEIEAALGG